MFPSDLYVSAPGDTVVCNCIHSSLLDVKYVIWLLNETQLQDSAARDVQQEYNSEIARVGTLTFYDLSVELNNTEITCEVVLSLNVTISSKNALNLQILSSKSMTLVNCYIHKYP